jgi:hypothetical protein
MEHLPLILSGLALAVTLVSSIFGAMLGYIVRQKDTQITELRAKVGRTFEALDLHKDEDRREHEALRERSHAAELALTKLDQLEGMQASVDRLAKEVALLREEFVRLKAAGPGRYSSKPSSSSLPAVSEPPKR